MSEIKFATCMLCEATCGVKVTVEGQKLVRIEGDEADPFSRGYICPKVTGLDDIRTDPDRITHPMKRNRTTGEWTRVSWDEALELAASKLADLRRAHGPHSVATYSGNPMAHSYAGILGSVALMKAMGSYSRFSPTSLDQLPHMLTAYKLFGHQLLMPVPDLDRTNYLLIIGGNPAVSNGSIMTAPGMRQRLKDLRARGGKVVVIDPRRTETAELADAHHFIRPGTDALLLFAMLHVIFDEQLEKVRLDVALTGLEAVRTEAKAFSPERVAPQVGIDAETIRALARDFAKAEGAASYPRMGACTQEFGGLTAWLSVVLDTVTGNLDRPGGKMFTLPAVDVVALSSRIGLRGSFAKFKSGVRGLPEFGGELPVAALAEEIDSDRENRIRALVTVAGNPVLSAPNSTAVDQALGKLDFMVAIDLYRNETTRHADLILPPTFGLERDHYDLVLYAFAVRNTARYARPVFEPAGETRPDWDICTDLGVRIAKKLGRRQFTAGLSAIRMLGSKRVLDLLMRLGPYGLSLSKLEKQPHGVDLGALRPRLAEIRAGKAIDLAPREYLDDVPRLAKRLDRPTDQLTLIGRRGLRSNNSWMHNVDRLTRGPKGCTLLIHPADATSRALKTGDEAWVRSRTGKVKVEVEVTEAISRGVVSLPHGWGHDRAGAALTVASTRAGVSANELTDETFLDALTANASLNGVVVHVERR